MYETTFRADNKMWSLIKPHNLVFTSKEKRQKKSFSIAIATACMIMNITIVHSRSLSIEGALCPSFVLPFECFANGERATTKNQRWIEKRTKPTVKKQTYCITYNVHGMSPHLTSFSFRFVSCALYTISSSANNNNKKKKKYDSLISIQSTYIFIGFFQYTYLVWLLLTVRHMLPIQMMSLLTIRPQNYLIDFQRFDSPYCLPIL